MDFFLNYTLLLRLIIITKLFGFQYQLSLQTVPTNPLSLFRSPSIRQVITESDLTRLEEKKRNCQSPFSRNLLLTQIDSIFKTATPTGRINLT